MRMAAASLAFNADALGAEGPGFPHQGGAGKTQRMGYWWSKRTVELVSAVVEAFASEEESEDARELYVSCAGPVIMVQRDEVADGAIWPHPSSASTDGNVGILDSAVAFL